MCALSTLSTHYNFVNSHTTTCCRNIHTKVKIARHSHYTSPQQRKIIEGAGWGWGWGRGAEADA